MRWSTVIATGYLAYTSEATVTLSTSTGPDVIGDADSNVNTNLVTSASTPAKTLVIPSQNAPRIKYDPLPILKAISGEDELKRTLDVFYDSNKPSSLAKWIAKRYTKDELKFKEKEAEEYYKEIHTKTQVWRELVHDRLPNEVSAADKPVYQNLTLVIPLAHHRLLWMWPIMESLLTSKVWPKEVILVTGLSDYMNANLQSDSAGIANHRDTTHWLVAERYISKDILPNLNGQVTIRWAQFAKPGGAAAGRHFGAVLSSTEYIRFNDADDLLGRSALQYNMQLLSMYPQIDHVLNSYTATYGDEAHNQAPPDVENAIRKTGIARTAANFKLALAHVADAYIRTEFDVDAVLRKFDIKKSTDEAFDSFENKNHHVDLGSVEEWPQLQFYRDCDQWEKLIHQAESNAEMTPEQQRREERAVAWFEESCSASRKPEYIMACHNGWSTIRRDAALAVPLVNPSFGEDSLFNFLVSHSGHQQVCTSGVTGGVYLIYRRSHEKETMGRLIFPTEI